MIRSRRPHAAGARALGLALAAGLASLGCAGGAPVEAGPAAPGTDPGARDRGTPSASAGGAQPTRRAWPVMGTLLEATVWGLDDEAAGTVMRAVRAAVGRVDTLMSNYRDDSDISRVNRAAGTGEWVAVDTATLHVVEAALRVARSSGGAFDPTVGPAVDVWGFYREQGAVPVAGALDSARALVDHGRVHTRASPPAIRLATHGMRLDLGAIGKGYAVDRALAAAAGSGASGLMIDLGGNIGVAGRPPGGGDWPLGLRHPRREGRAFAVFEVGAGAVATSGDYERFFVVDGVRYAHILDPRSGRPVQGIASVSVLAPTGTDSDALSTTLFVLGPDAGCRSVPADASVIWVLAPRDGEETRADAPLEVVLGGNVDRVRVADDVRATTCDAPRG